MRIAAQLGTLENAGLIELATVEPDLAYLFRHALVREAAYLSLLRGDRRALHLAVGETLERLYTAEGNAAPGGPRGLLAMLGHHFGEAGDAGRALKYLTLAGDEAGGVYANGEAIQHYSRAIVFAAHAAAGSDQMRHLFLQRGRAHELSGDYESALATYDALVNLGRERADRALEMAGIIQCALVYATPATLFDTEQAIRLAGEALALAQELGDAAAEARVQWILLLAHMAGERIHAAIEAGEIALRLARENNQQELTAYVLTDLGRAYGGANRASDAYQLLTEARELWQSLNNLPMLAESVNNLGTGYAFAGEFARAEAYFDEGRQISRSIGNAWGQAFSLMLLTMVHFCRGKFSRAIATAEACLLASEEAGFLYARVGLPALQGWLYAELGQPEVGLAHVREAMALAVGPQFSNERSQISAVVGLLHLHLGHIDEARAHILEAQREYNSEDRYSFSPMLNILAQSEMALAMAEYQHAVKVISDHLASLEQTGMSLFLGHTLMLRARAYLGLGQTAEARADLLSSLRLAEAQGAAHITWQAHYWLSELERQFGNAAAAAEQMSRARAGLSDVLADIDEPGLRQSLLSTPIAASVWARGGAGH